MSRYAIMKKFVEWESLDFCKGYFEMVILVINRHPHYLDKLVAMNLKDEIELWEVMKEGI